MFHLASQLSYPVFLQQCVKCINVFGTKSIGIKVTEKEITFCANKAVVRDPSPQAFITVAVQTVFEKYEINIAVADEKSKEETTGASTNDGDGDDGDGDDEDAIFMIVDAESLDTLLKGTDDAANTRVTLDVEPSGNYGAHDIILRIRRTEGDAECIHATRNLRVKVEEWDQAEMGEPDIPVYDAAILIHRCQTIKRATGKFMQMADTGIMTIGDGNKLVIGMQNAFLSSVFTTFLPPTVGDAEFYPNIKKGVSLLFVLVPVFYFICKCVFAVFVPDCSAVCKQSERKYIISRFCVLCFDFVGFVATIPEEEAAVDAKQSQPVADMKVEEKKTDANEDEEPVTVGYNLAFLHRSLDATHQFGGGMCKLFIRQYKVVTIACQSTIGKLVVFCPCLVPEATM